MDRRTRSAPIWTRSCSPGAYLTTPPLQVMAEQGQGDMATFGWFVASVILALGVGLWVNFWLPWWAGAAVGIPIAVVFQIYAYDETSGRLIPTPAGLCEISLWSAFGRSIGSRRVSPSLDPSQHDTLLPYAVALNEARQWIVDQRDQCSAALVSPRRPQGTDPRGPLRRLPRFHRRRLLGFGRGPKNQALLSQERR